MKTTSGKNDMTYRPVLFLTGTFLITWCCAVLIPVLILFAAQFFNFYLFKMEDCGFSVQTFAVTFAGQLLLGGGLVSVKSAKWEKHGSMNASAPAEIP